MTTELNLDAAGCRCSGCASGNPLLHYGCFTPACKAARVKRDAADADPELGPPVLRFGPPVLHLDSSNAPDDTAPPVDLSRETLGFGPTSRFGLLRQPVDLSRFGLRQDGDGKDPNPPVDLSRESLGCGSGMRGVGGRR